MTQEEKDFWDKYGDQVPAEIDDEINGDDVVSLESLEDTDDEPYSDPFGTEN